MSFLKKVFKGLPLGLQGKIKSAYVLLRSIPGGLELALIRRQVLLALGNRRSLSASKLRVCVFPNRLNKLKYLQSGGYALEKILTVLNPMIIQYSPWEKYDVLINWQDLTHNSINTDSYINEAFAYTGLRGPSIRINLQCNDISKKSIGLANKAVLGYELDIDPSIYEGLVVCKSDANATHDGSIIKCPIDINRIQQLKTYNVLIDNTDGEWVYDMRMIYMGQILDFFYLKWRPIGERFSNTNSHVEIKDTLSYFDQNEIQNLNSICKQLRLDYGEVDVLRDRKTKKIYLVDVAKTPAGPPNGLPWSEARKAIQKMSVAFANNLLLVEP